MFVMTILFSFLWGKLIADRLYNCTDSIGFGYVRPGSWVHGKIAYVPEIITGRSMSEPDTIKEGWSIAGLWVLWFAMVGVSFGVSLLFAKFSGPARHSRR